MLYLSQISRPDIAFVTSLFKSRFNNNYTIAHWNAVKRVFKYTKDTLDYKLEFKYELNFNVYCDADWANKLNNRYSVIGSSVKINGCLISWYSKRQKTIALSTTEAEYMSLSFTVQEVLWIKQLIADNLKPVIIYCDNVGTIHLAKNIVTSQRSKYIDIRHHFVREHIEVGDISVEYLSSDSMPADVLTKSLAKIK